jgi:hypothetical protein
MFPEELVQRSHPPSAVFVLLSILDPSLKEKITGFSQPSPPLNPFVYSAFGAMGVLSVNEVVIRHSPIDPPEHE